MTSSADDVIDTNLFILKRVEYLENNKPPQLQHLLEDCSDEDHIFKKVNFHETFFLI